MQSRSIFSWNQLFSNFFSKSIDLTEKLLIFSVKFVIAFFSIFPRCTKYDTQFDGIFSLFCRNWRFQDSTGPWASRTVKKTLTPSTTTPTWTCSSCRPEPEVWASTWRRLILACKFKKEAILRFSQLFVYNFIIFSVFTIRIGILNKIYKLKIVAIELDKPNP